MIAGIVLKIIGPVLGAGALPIVVFVVGMLVVSLRSAPKINNLLCYFLGLVSFFASHYTPSIDNFLALAAAVTIGSFAGLTSSLLQNIILFKTKG